MFAEEKRDEHGGAAGEALARYAEGAALFAATGSGGVTVAALRTAGATLGAVEALGEMLVVPTLLLDTRAEDHDYA